MHVAFIGVATEKIGRTCVPARSLLRAVKGDVQIKMHRQTAATRTSVRRMLALNLKGGLKANGFQTETR